MVGADRLLQISSLQNHRIKQLINLKKRRERDRSRLTTVEGVREIGHALAADIIPVEVYCCPEYFDAEAQQLFSTLETLASSHKTTIYLVTAAIFAKIAYRGESGGLFMTIPYITRDLMQLPLSPNPFFVIVEGVEKPGNLGAIMRTADAVNVDGVIVCAGATDLHNPNVVRASLGALFTVPIVETERETLINWLHQHGIQIVAADPIATTYHMAAPLGGPVAIVMGSEADGLTPEWLQVADISVKIPMFGTVDSLNLSVATAVLLYEAVRQRVTPPQPTTTIA